MKLIIGLRYYSNVLAQISQSFWEYNGGAVPIVLTDSSRGVYRE